LVSRVAHGTTAHTTPAASGHGTRRGRGGQQLRHRRRPPSRGHRRRVWHRSPLRRAVGCPDQGGRGAGWGSEGGLSLVAGSGAAHQADQRIGDYGPGTALGS
jgi:hypothetical protein